MDNSHEIHNKIIATIAIVLIAIAIPASQLTAEPFPNTVITLRQPNGIEFRAVLSGDEYYMQVETVEGYSIVKKNGVWHYAVSENSGNIRPGESVVGVDKPEALAKQITPSSETIDSIRTFRQSFAIEQRTVALDPLSSAFEKPLTILADFELAPYSHLYTREQFYDVLYSAGIYPTGSMNDYYSEVSYGSFSFSAGPYDITDWITAPQSYDWYCNGQSGMGSWPQNSQGLLVDLANALDPVVNFADYDMDRDGNVDAITIIVEGGMDGSGDNFLAHAGRLNSHKIQLDGVWIDLFDLIYEQLDGQIRPIGTFAHEFGHILGVPDLYDKDRSSVGIGYWGLMAYGGWNTQTSPAHMSAWSKTLLGWAFPVNITQDQQGVVIQNSESYPEMYRLWTDGNSGSEYFLVENRQPIGFDSYAAGSGLLIWHIDENQSNNDDETHKKVDLEEADGEHDLDYHNNYSDAGDPYPGVGGLNNPNITFNSVSDPNSYSYHGTPTAVAVKNISEYSGTITADLTVTAPADIPALSQWGMILLGLLLMGLATIILICKNGRTAVEL